MIRWQRSARSSGARNLEAVQWAKEVTDYINNNHPDHKVQVFSSRFGDVSMLLWQADFDDLAALDKYQESFNTDQGYWEMVNKATGFFIEGTIHDSVFESL